MAKSSNEQYAKYPAKKKPTLAELPPNKREIARRKRSDLPHGMVKLVKQLNHRVPADANEGQRAVANRAFERVVNVMEGKVSFRQAPSVLKAAMYAREEICGPVPKELNVKVLSLEALLARVEDGEVE